MTRFQLSTRATFDIEDAIAYLERESVASAMHWEDQLYGALHRLARFPLSAPARPELADPPVRVLALGRHLVFYDPTCTPLRILRVAQASRNLTDSFLLGVSG